MARVLVLFLAMIQVVSVGAAPFTDLIVFGDSLSDMGNVASASFDFVPGPYYWNDRFSNGPVWVETLSAQLGLGALQRSTAGGDNFAYGGAKTTGTDGLEGLFIRDLDEQVAQFLGSRTVDPSALYVVFAGSNDLIQGQTDVFLPVTKMAADLGRLIAAGARNFLIPNLPLLGFTPRFNDSITASAQYNQRTQQFNDALSSSLSTLEAGARDVVIHRLDVADLFSQAIAAPQRFGLTNVTDAAASGLAPGDFSYDASQIAENVDEFLFWDDLHPTAAVHAILAVRALALADAIPGDFNADGYVDTQDMGDWRQKFGKLGGALRNDGDADSDGDVDGADLLAWQRNLSRSNLRTAVATVPEPQSIALLAALCIGKFLASCGEKRR